MTPRPEYPLFYLVRRNDPITSHKAAETVNVSECERIALDAIKRFPGKSANELERLTGDQRGVIHRRISGLVRKGLVRREYPENCREAKLYLVRDDEYEQKIY
jgi:predicted HTH transcriptional regulator